MTDFEMFLDIDTYGIAVLYDEENNETEFEKQAIVPYEGKLYAVMTTPVSTEENPVDENDIEIAVFELENVDGEVSLTLVVDDDLYDTIINLCIADEEGEDEEGEDA